MLGILPPVSIRSRLSSLPLSRSLRIHGDRVCTVAMAFQEALQHLFRSRDPFADRATAYVKSAIAIHWLGPASAVAGSSLLQLFVVRAVYSRMPVSIVLVTLPLRSSPHPSTNKSSVRANAASPILLK